MVAVLVLDDVMDEVWVVLGDVKLHAMLSRPSLSAVSARLTLETVDSQSVLSRKLPCPAQVRCVEANANFGNSALSRPTAAPQSFLTTSMPLASHSIVPITPVHASISLFTRNAWRVLMPA